MRNWKLTEIIHTPTDVIDDQDIRKEREYLKGMVRGPEHYVEAIEYLYAHSGPKPG